MRKLIYFLIGVMTVAIMLAALIVTSAIYDARAKQQITPFFFQPAYLSQRRVEAPKSTSEIGDNVVRNMLVRKYINEYFYVIPDSQNVQYRINGKYPNNLPTALRGISMSSVFKQWVQDQAPEIQKLAEKNAMRTTNVTNISVGDTGHLIVDYELKTWFNANDMYEKPTLTRGRIYLGVKYTPGTDTSVQALKRLESGVDAASAFQFMVTSVDKE